MQENQMAKTIVGSAGIALLAVLAFMAFPSNLSATHRWATYHWPRANNPVAINLGKNIGSAWLPYLQTASDDWNQSSVLQTTLVKGGTTKASCLPTNGRVEVCAYTYGNNGWLGLAQIWVNGDHIYQGTAQMNTTYFKQPQYNTPAWKRLVMCQEVGHTFGLNHQDTNFNNPNLGTCMDYTSNPVGPPSNEHPDQHDYDELGIIYTHFDTAQADEVGAGMPPAMNEIELSGLGQWGRPISGSRESGTSLYELDFGGGKKVFTFVTWAK